MARRQSVRLSQMVLTWGPGAILESIEGPRIVLRNGLQLPPGMSLDDLQLHTPEMEALLPRLLGMTGEEPVGIFQIPGTGMVENPLWKTKPFPDWHLCVTHHILYRGRCPECEQEGRPWWRRRREAIRFVRACPAGHLDDVDWDALVHGGNVPHQPPGHYLWESHGTGLYDIHIRCPRCGRAEQLGKAYGRSWPCSGRFPEREDPGEPPHRPGCQQEAYILQRQASNLRVPEIISLFTVPPPFTELHQILERIKDAFVPGLVLKGDNLDRSVLEEILEHFVKTGRLKASERDEILRCPDQEIALAIRKVEKYDPPANLSDLLLQEFHAFLEGASKGIPPVVAPRPHSRVLLEINPALVRRFSCFLVVPVTRLRVVTVQVGYRRSVGPMLEEEGLYPDLVDISILDHKGKRWFPGYESMGEGLFITLADNEGWIQSPGGAAANTWATARSHPGSYDRNFFRDDRYTELHPLFVAWHTFSHLLIRALAVDSGYSSPSIRERVYLEEADDRVRGGVLIYTATRGGDGSMGGLLVLVEVFDRVLERIREMAHFCSADPLCQEHQFQPGEVVGAACHACCMVPETSCEHRNLWLDRNILLETGWL